MLMGNKKSCSRQVFLKWWLTWGIITFLFVFVLAIITTHIQKQGNQISFYNDLFFYLFIIFSLFEFIAAFFLLVISIRRARGVGMCPWLLCIPVVVFVTCSFFLIDKGLSNMDDSVPLVPNGVLVILCLLLLALLFVFGRKLLIKQ